MRNNRVNYLIILAFILGFITLMLLRFYAIANMNDLLRGNAKLSAELRSGNYLRTVDHNLLGVENRIRAAIATNDTTHLSGIDGKVQELQHYLDSLKNGTTDHRDLKDINQLAKRAREKQEVAHQLSNLYLRTGNLSDTSYIANPRARMISDEITGITENIYDHRQEVMTNITHNINENGRVARVVGNMFIIVVFISGCLLCWYIIRQFRSQDLLISQLDNSEKKALEALQIKENFLANMSHEIRTPLNSILGFTNLLKKQPLNSSSGEFVQSIQGAGENLLTIINDILDLSKIEAGMMRIVNMPFSLRGLMHSIETLFSEKLNEKGLQFSYSIQHDIPDTLTGDATRLTQILVNLIGNAIKFSDQGNITIKIFSTMANATRFELGFTITDNGIGIEQQKLEQIFERFNQGEDFITRNYGGTGLGLSIVKNLIVLQQGTIQVKSAPGEGTEFTFYIPYAITKEQPGQNHPVQKNNFVDVVNPDTRILIVDDNTMNQSLMRHLLMQWNTSFDIVSNGLEAISQLQQKVYHLILMDIQMPKMDGYSTADVIRNDLRLDIPIIAMTAHAMAGEREKCIARGMNEYIAKPINEDDLFAMITRFILMRQTKETFPSSAKAERWQYIDLTYMRSISKGNTSYEKTVTTQFITCLPDDLHKLAHAWQRKQWDEISRIAHNMKTSVAIMGLLPKLEKLLNKLEDAPASKDQDLQPVINELQNSCTNSLAEAHLFLKIIDPA